MAELHEYPFTQYEDCSMGCFMGLCKRVGVKLAVVGDSLQLLDRNNFVLSQVKIYQATTALQDEEGHNLTAYIINAGVRDEHVVFTKGNGDQIVIDVPKAEVAEKDSDGNDITSYLMNMTVSGDKLHVTRGDGSSFEVTVPFAVKAATTVDNIPLTTLAASMEVSGQNIILKDSRDNVISTIRCAWSDRAQSDENGNNIRENYGSTLQAGTTTIKLISKSSDVLSEITVPYSTTSTYSPSGAEFDAEFGAHLVIDADGKSVDLTAQNGQLLNKITVPFSTLSTDATNAIERAEISGDQLVLTTYGGTVIRLTCPYSVRSLKDNSSNVITTYYAHSMTQDPVTGKITLWDAEGNALSELVPTANVAQYDTYNNLIADYIKTLVFDNQSDYLVATHGDGTTDSIVINYSNVAWKDTQGNIIKNTYVAFVSNVVDGEGDWVMVFYNGSGAELFRLKVVANKAQRDAAGNVITEFYVHSLTISGDTISYNNASDLEIGTITLPKYVKDFTFSNGYLQLLDIDGNIVRSLKVPVEDLLGLVLVDDDEIALTDENGQDLNAISRVHLPEYIKSGEVSGSNLLLKDIHGNTISTIALPSGANFVAVNDGISGIGNIIRTSDHKLVAVNPKVVNIVDGSNQTKVIAKIIYYADWDGQYSPYVELTYSYNNTVTLAPDELKAIRGITYQSGTTNNYISNLYVDYNGNHYYGVKLDPNTYSSGSLVSVPPFNASWMAYNSGSAVAKGFNFADAAYGPIMQNIMSANITLDSNTVIKSTWSGKNIGFGVQDIKIYPNSTNVAMCNNVQVTWDGSYSTGFLRGFTNGTGISISKVKTDGTVATASFRMSLSGGSCIIRTASCASDETNVVKIHVHTNDTFTTSAGDIELFMAFPAGITIGQS